MALSSGAETLSWESTRPRCACQRPAARRGIKSCWMTSQLRPSGAARNTRRGRWRSRSSTVPRGLSYHSPRLPRSSGGPRHSWTPWPTNTASWTTRPRPVTAPHRSQSKPRSTRRSRRATPRVAEDAPGLLLLDRRGELAGANDAGRAPAHRATRRPRAGRAADPAARAGQGHPGPTRGRRGRRERGPRPRAPATVGGWCCTAPGSPTSPTATSRSSSSRPVRSSGRAHPARTRADHPGARGSPAWSSRALHRRERRRPAPVAAHRARPPQGPSSKLGVGSRQVVATVFAGPLRPTSAAPGCAATSRPRPDDPAPGDAPRRSSDRIRE